MNTQKILTLKPDFFCNFHKTAIHHIVNDPIAKTVRIISSDGILSVRDSSSMKIIKTVDYSSCLYKTNKIQVSILIPDSNLLLYQTCDLNVTIFDLKTLSVKGAVPGVNGGIRSFDTTTDGNYLIISNHHQEVKIINLHTFQIVGEYKTYTFAVTFLSQNGNSWISTTSMDDKLFIGYVANTRFCKKSDIAPYFNNLCYFSVRKLLIATTYEGEVRFLSLQTLKTKYRFKILEQSTYDEVTTRITRINIINNGRFVCGMSDGSLYVYHINQVIRNIKEESRRTFVLPTLPVSAKRLFIFGAGVSVYTGLPLGCRLVDFILRSNSEKGDQYALERDTVGLSWLLAYVLSADNFEDMLRDAEKSLTDLVYMCYGKNFNPDLRANDTRLYFKHLSDKKNKEFIFTHYPQEEAQRILLFLETNLRWREYSTAEKKARLKNFAKCNHTRWQDISYAVKTIDDNLKHLFCLQSIINSYSRAFVRYLYHLRRYMTDRKASPYLLQFQNESSLCELDKTVNGIKRYFQKGDIVVMFNWDTFLEYILSISGLANLPAVYGINVMWDEGVKKSASQSKTTSPVYVLKPHGSVNWLNFNESVGVFKRNINQNAEIYINNTDALFGWNIKGTHRNYMQDVYQDEMDYEEQKMFDTEPIIDEGLDMQRIMAPMYRKRYDKVPLLFQIWKKVNALMENAEEIIICGYSLPESDKDATRNIKSSLAKNKGCRIKIVTHEVPDTWKKIFVELDKDFVQGNYWFSEWICEHRDF